MKRLMLVCVMILALCLSFSIAGEENTSLYPIRENGLWGYMNRAGEVVIEPKWTGAEPFRGRYAVVYPGTNEPDVDLRDFCGIIDSAGNWILEPGYRKIISYDNWGQYIGGRDEGIYIVWSLDHHQKENYAGYFDIPSGFWSGMCYEWVDGEWYGDVDPELVCVTIGDLKGFVRRITGEQVIPCQYDPFQYYYFKGDYCAVMHCDTDVADGWILIDRTGREIQLPENCYLTGHIATVEDGLIPVWLTVPEDEEENYDENDWFEEDNDEEEWDEKSLCGYIDLEGNLIIEPQYNWAYSFHEGRACVVVDQEYEQTAVITSENEVVAVFPDSANRLGSSSQYNHGLLQLAHYTEDDDLAYIAFFNRSGEEVFRLEAENLYNALDPFSNGIALYLTGTEDPYGGYTDERCGIFSIEGGILTPPVFATSESIAYRDFSEELLHLTEADSGKVGFIDITGKWVIPPQYDSAASFRDGLALVEKDGKLMYIDHSGAVVWEE